MRIISGDKKGQKLVSLKRKKLRPTSDKVKGAIFNILKSVEGKKVLDLFAGSGALGIEALSRGAEEVKVSRRYLLWLRVLDVMYVYSYSLSSHLLLELFCYLCSVSILRCVIIFDLHFYPPDFQLQG